GEALRVPDRSELLDGDDLGIGGLALGGPPVPPRQPSRPHGPHWTPLCLTHSAEYVTQGARSIGNVQPKAAGGVQRVTSPVRAGGRRRCRNGARPREPR